jgi:hypothetical protein
VPSAFLLVVLIVPGTRGEEGQLLALDLTAMAKTPSRGLGHHPSGGHVAARQILWVTQQDASDLSSDPLNWDTY